MLRRRPPLELRPLRVARAAPRLRHQRLRRDPARPVGVGRQAPGREHPDRRARQRVRRPARRDRIVLDTVREYRSWMRGVRHRCETSRSGTRSSRSRACSRPPRPRRHGDAEAGSTARRQGASAATACRRTPSSRPRSTGAHRIVSRPPLIVRLDDFDEASRSASERPRRPRADAAASTALTLQHDSRKLLEQFRLVDVARKVVGRRQRRDRRLDRAARSAVPARTSSSSRSRRRSGRCSRSSSLASEYANAGERVVAGQRIMQAVERHLPRLVHRRRERRRHADATTTSDSSATGRGPLRSRR